MPKTKVSDWDVTPALNTEINSISIVGTAAVSNFDNAEREMMSQFAKVLAGTDALPDTTPFGDPANLTKRVRLDAGNITAGTTRVLTVPDQDVTITAAGAAILDDADASAQRTTLGLGTIATQAASSVAITGGTINSTTIGVTTPAVGIFTILQVSDLSTTLTNFGLNNVNNTSDANKPISTATQTALDLKAPLASPTFTGTPAAPTAAAATNTTQVATTAYVRTAVPNVLNASGSAPVYACRAWAKFDGSGTIAINGSANVATITRISTGVFEVTFLTAMSDANYAVVASCGASSTDTTVTVDNNTTALFRLYVVSSGALANQAGITFAVFG